MVCTYATPTDYVVFVLPKACAKLKVVENGQQIHAHICGNRVVESNVFYLMDMYSKVVGIDQVRDVVHKVSFRDVVPWKALLAQLVFMIVRRFTTYAMSRDHLR